MSTYNGWSNHATWAAHLHIANDNEYQYRIACRLETPEQFREFFGPILNHLDGEKINWSEICEAFNN